MAENNENNKDSQKGQVTPKNIFKKERKIKKIVFSVDDLYGNYMSLTHTISYKLRFFTNKCLLQKVRNYLNNT
jgi:hypothetical protein